MIPGQFFLIRHLQKKSGPCIPSHSRTWYKTDQGMSIILHLLLNPQGFKVKRFGLLIGSHGVI
jgi:hypothetical protein